MKSITKTQKNKHQNPGPNPLPSMHRNSFRLTKSERNTQNARFLGHDAMAQSLQLQLGTSGLCSGTAVLRRKTKEFFNCKNSPPKKSNTQGFDCFLGFYFLVVPLHKKGKGFDMFWLFLGFLFLVVLGRCLFQKLEKNVLWGPKSYEGQSPSSKQKKQVVGCWNEWLTNKWDLCLSPLAGWQKRNESSKTISAWHQVFGQTSWVWHQSTMAIAALPAWLGWKKLGGEMGIGRGLGRFFHSLLCRKGGRTKYKKQKGAFYTIQALKETYWCQLEV